jgi:sigma-B regulation protein RsbU (phosphoserine phosphatase)
MRILVAEDGAVARLRLEKILGEWGFEVESFQNGEQALTRLSEPDPPRLCILDWVMPGMDGTELCRRIREQFPEKSFYLIILTARQGIDNVIEGLGAGADDYVTKPFVGRELRMRMDVGIRVLNLEQSLNKKVTQLEEALEDVKSLQGLLPICSYCNKIRNDEDYWEKVDTYITRHADVEFSHSICPTCYKQHVQPMLDQHRMEERPESSSE